MRRMAPVILCVSASALLIFGPRLYGDTGTDSAISFSVPFICQADSNDVARCLADAFKPGLSAVLLDKMGVCGARTTDAFTYNYHTGDLEATRLSGTEECFTVRDNERLLTRFSMAVVGADPAAVRLVPLKDDKSPVPKEIELKARKLAAVHIEEPQKLYDGSRVPISVSDAQPKVLRTDNVTLLIFELQADGEPWEPGPTVALTSAGVFRLDGACTYGEPVFFSVNDKLYLTYDATVHCCGCGDTNFFVYDLSSGTPKLVYRNSSFSD